MKKILINKKTLVCFFILMPFFEPQYLKTFPQINKGYKIFLYAVAVYLMINVVFNLVKTRKLPSFNVILIVLLETWMFVVTYINHGLFNTAMSNVIAFGCFSYIVYIYSNQFERLIRCLLFHFELCIYVNLLTHLLPNGLYWIDNGVYRATAGYFLGWHHLFLIWEFPGLITAWIYRDIFHENVRCYLLSFAVIVCELFYGGSTGLVGVAAIVFLKIFPGMKKVFTPYKGVVAAALGLACIIFIRSYDFLEPIIVGVLNGDMTFTGRLVIWDNAIIAIKINPIIGHGIQDTGKIVSMLGFTAATHCHDQVLQILFQGGVIGFSLFVALYFINLRECNRYWKYGCAQTCAYGIIVFTIISITEPFEYVLMYLVFILPFYLKQISEIEDFNLCNGEN